MPSVLHGRRKIDRHGRPRREVQDTPRKSCHRAKGEKGARKEELEIGAHLRQSVFSSVVERSVHIGKVGGPIPPRRTSESCD